MGIGDWIKKGLDVVAPPVDVKPIPKPAETKTVEPKAVVSTSNVNQEIYEQVMSSLLLRGKVLNDFKTKLKSVEDVIPDTSQRYKAMAKSMAVGKEVLLSALGEQKAGINTELKKFEDEMSGFEVKASQSKGEIDSYENGIKNLQDEIAKLQAKKEEVETKLSKQTSQISQLRGQFDDTIKFIESEYSEMERNLNLYIN